LLLLSHALSVSPRVYYSGMASTIIPPHRYRRFLMQIDLSADDCWPWLGVRDSDGYGMVRWKEDGRLFQRGAHRVAYDLLVGPIPDGLELDHLCRNRLCVDPEHLE